MRSLLTLWKKNLYFLLRFSTGDVRTAAAHELARQTSDRVSMLESDHSRMVIQVDNRHASLSEFNDWVMNKSEEDWLEITGCLLF